MYSLQEREAALGAAVDLFANDPDTPTAETVLACAAAFLGFLSGARLRLTVDALGTVPPARTGSRPEAASQSLPAISLSGPHGPMGLAAASGVKLEGTAVPMLASRLRGIW